MGQRLNPSQLYSTASATAAVYGLGGVVRNVFALIITAIGFVMTRGIDAVGATFIDPLFALANAGVEFVNAMFVDPAAALSGAWEFALTSVTTGDWAFFGPFTPLVMLGVVLGGIAMYLWFADRYDIDLPTTGDIPFVGLDESGADDEQ